MGIPLDDGRIAPRKRVGSARTSKQMKKRRVIRYIDWAERPAYMPELEDKSVDADAMGVREQVQDAGSRAGPSPEPVGYVTVHTPSESSFRFPTPSDHQSRETSPNNRSIANGSIPLPDSQHGDDSSPESFPLFPREETGENHEFQQSEEEQEADDWPSENMRPNAQNLRYGGYPTQPAPQHRSTPLGSGRLQNASKLGVLELFTSHLVQ